MWGYNNTGYPNGPMPNSPYGDPGLSTSPAVRPMQNVGAGPRAAGQLWKQAQHGPMHSPQQPPSFGYHNNGQPMYGGDFRTMYSRPSNTIPNAMVEPPPMSNQPPIYGNGGVRITFKSATLYHPSRQAMNNISIIHLRARIHLSKCIHITANMGCALQLAN
ncbi:hypothetical protein BC829DRAFT_290762 [Chytridium lagenaria]|nr:hypothetical protein BC829DRAFT_290762 [Chytridium lagenaria]